MESVTSLVSPTDWDSAGGQSSLRLLGDLLLVRTTRQNHRQIASLLNCIRRRAAVRKVVCVEVHWLWLSEDELHRLAPASIEKDDKRSAVCLTVDDAAWDRLAKERAAEDSDVRAGFHAIISCLNGQTVVAAAGRQTRVIVSMIPVVGGPPGPSGAVNMTANNGPPASVAGTPCYPPPPVAPPNQPSVGYQPTTTTIQEGPAVEIRPVLCGKSQILFDVHSRVIELQTSETGGGAPAKSPAANQEANLVRDLAAVVDRPQMSAHRIDTTLRAALGRRVLVGGITFGTEPEPGDRSLYVFVKGVVCEPPTAVPAAKTKP